MALRFVSGLSNFADLPANVQKRLARADEIDRIPFERRTRQQEAFLASVEGELESLRSNPSAMPVEAVEAKLPQVERQVFQKNDGSFENLFSTPLYPVRERLASGDTSRVALPEMNLPAALEDGSLQVNTLPAVFGVQRGYSTAPAARASDKARNAPAIPRRLLSEEDRISDAAFNEAIAELRSQGVDIPAAKLSSSGVQDTLVDIYQSLINRTQSPGYVPGQMRDVQSSSDVPAYMIQSGRAPEDAWGTGFVTRPEEKGRNAKRNVLLDPTAADIINVNDLVGLDIASSPGLITTSNDLALLRYKDQQAALEQIQDELAAGSDNFYYSISDAVKAGASGRGDRTLPGQSSIKELGIEDTSTQDASGMVRVVGNTPLWSVLTGLLPSQKATTRNLIGRANPGIVLSSKTPVQTARLLPIDSAQLILQRAKNTGEQIKQLAGNVSYTLPLVRPNPDPRGFVFDQKKSTPVVIPVDTNQSYNQTALAAINKIDEVLQGLDKNDPNYRIISRQLRSQQDRIRAERLQNLQDSRNKTVLESAVEQVGYDPTSIQMRGDRPVRRDQYVQSAGRGIFSGSGRLQNIFSRELALFPEQSPDNRRISNSPIGRIGAQLQQPAPGPAYQNRMIEGGLARSQAETERLAFNDQIAQQIIGQDRASARLAEEEGTIIDSSSQPITPRERLNAVTNLAAQYIDQIATSGAKKTRVGLPSGSIGISYPRTLGPVLDNPAILRTQTIRDLPPGLSGSQAKQVQDADLEFDTDVNLDLGQSVSVPGVVQIASGTHSSLTPYSITTGNAPPGQQTRYSRISAIPIDPVNPELDELQGRLTKRFYRQGIDFQDVDNRLQQGQKALLGQLQAVTDSVAAPTVSRTMDPFTASQGALAYIDEQLSRLAPYANTPSVPGTTYRSTAGSREVRGYEQTNPYEATVRELSEKRNRINTLLQNYQYLDDQRQRFAKSTAGLFDLAESAEDAKNITLDGDELVPLQEYMDYLVETPTVSRFGIPQQTGSPRLTGEKTSRGRQLFSYGAPDNVSILPDPSLFYGDSKVLDAIRAIDPTAVPNQVRAGIQYREVPRPNSSAYDIIVDNPGVPVLDPATGRPMMADPRAMVGIDSQIGRFAEPRLPENIDSNRSILQERKAAELEGYSSVPLNQNVPIKHLKPVRSTINRQIAGQDYQVVDSSQDGRPIIRQYTSTAPAQTQEPELPLGVTEPRPEYDPRQVALSSAPHPVSLFTGQSQRQLPLPRQLSDIDSLSAQDPAQRGQLFDLAKELQITGTALGDPRNDFLGLKNEIKARLTSRYPERYATNATFYRNRLPSDATEPAEARQLVDNRIDSTLQSLSFRPIDPSDSNDRYSMQLIAGRMRQDPGTAERVFGYLDSESTRIQSQMQQQSDVLQSIARQIDSNPQQLVSIDQPSSPLTPTPKKLLLPARDAYQAKLSQLKELERRQNILQSNMASIRKLYGY